MNEVLTVAEIHARFPSEWILLGDPQTDTYRGVQAGTMIWHSKDRDEVYRKASETTYPHIAIFYTGKIPRGRALLSWCPRGPWERGIFVAGKLR